MNDFGFTRRGLIIQCPTRVVEVALDTSCWRYELVSKKFNPMWLLNIVYILGLMSLAIVISLLGYKFGGELAFIVSLYPAYYLGSISMFFIVDPEEKFWTRKYKQVRYNK